MGKLTQTLRARICDKCLYFNPKFYLSVFETASTCPALTFTSSLFCFEIISPSVISLSNHLHDLRLKNLLVTPEPLAKHAQTHIYTHTHTALAVISRMPELIILCTCQQMRTPASVRGRPHTHTPQELFIPRGVEMEVHVGQCQC